MNTLSDRVSVCVFLCAWVCVGVCVWSPRVSPQTLCVSPCPLLSLLQGPCLSLTKRGYLCPLFIGNRKRYCSSPCPTSPLLSVCFLSSLFFCSLIFFTFPSSRFNHHLALYSHSEQNRFNCTFSFFSSSHRTSCMWSCFVRDRAVCSQIRERMCLFGWRLIEFDEYVCSTVCLRPLELLTKWERGAVYLCVLT